MSDLISRKAAIDAIAEHLGIPAANWKDIAKEWLKDLPTAQPEPSQIACDIATILDNEQDMRVILKNAQPERMRGRWIEIQAPDSDGNGLYECSVCHRGEVHVPIVEVPFCWHCGAYMKED